VPSAGQPSFSAKAIGISPSAYAKAARAAVPPAGFGHHVNMEGFMFPATYQVRPHEAPSTLVSQQLEAFRAAFAQVNMSYARSKHLSPYDVLIIASMIEREAKVPGDRAKVAAVIYNRLHLGMPLGIDATILYHLGSWTATIHQSDLTDPERAAVIVRTASELRKVIAKNPFAGRADHRPMPGSREATRSPVAGPRFDWRMSGRPGSSSFPPGPATPTPPTSPAARPRRWLRSRPTSARPSRRSRCRVRR